VGNQREIAGMSGITGKVMKKATNDTGFSLSIMNQIITCFQKYSTLSSAAMESCGCEVRGGGGRCATKVSLRWRMILSMTA